MALGSLTRKIFGSANDRRVNKYLARVEKINALEPELKSLSDDELLCMKTWKVFSVY